ncbi:MAG: hypothetical protein V7603_5035 [Micromonosporaceae bacterium]
MFSARNKSGGPARHGAFQQLALPDVAAGGRVSESSARTGAESGKPAHGAGERHPMAWTKPAGRRSDVTRRLRRARRIERRHPTGELRECEPCAIAGRTRLGVTRSPGLVACLRCWQLHERMGVWPSPQHPHDVDACRLCRPSAQPAEDEDGAAAPILGSLLPYNPVDRPLSASRPSLADPWQVVALAQRFADEHAATGRPLRLGHDFGRVEVGVAEVYAALTAAYGPVVRPSVREVHTRAGCGERRAQYALRALQRAGLLYQHADGCLVRGDDGQVERLAAEYELRMPLAYLDQAQLMEELDETVDRDLLDAYLAAVQMVRGDDPEPAVPAGDDARLPAPVDGHCTPLVGLLIPTRSRSSDTVPVKDQERVLTDNQGASSLATCDRSPSVKHPRTRRGYALARKLVDRAPRWASVPLPVLAGALLPLADLGWSAYQVDRATETYGPVTSPTGLTRTLHAVIDYATEGPQRRREALVTAFAKEITAAELAARRSPVVWTDTSEAARLAYQLAAQARINNAGEARPAGWDTLRALIDPPPSPASPAAGEPTCHLPAEQRSAQILAQARRRAAADRSRRATR